MEASQDTVHYDQGTGAMILMHGDEQPSIKLTNKLATTAPQPEHQSSPVAYWGNNNRLPLEMQDDINRTGVLFAGIEAKARIAVGKGPTPAIITGFNDDGYEQLEFINDSEILDWLEMNRAMETSLATVRDLYSSGNAFTHLLFNADRSYLHAYKRLDYTECRLEKWSEASNRINNLWMSSDWDRYNDSDEGRKYVKVIPLLDRDYPLLDLVNRNTGSSFAVVMQYALSGRKYYSPSPWYSAIKWVRIAQGVPEMKAAMFNNQMNLKYVVEVHPDFWQHYNEKYQTGTPAEKMAIRQEFLGNVDKYLVGGENSFKSLWAPMKSNNVNGNIDSLIKVTAVDDKIKDGKLLPDSAAANIEILLPLMINAALLGVDMPGGGAYSGGSGSGSNIREAFLVQVMLLEQERKMNNSVFDIAKHVNGWKARHAAKGQLVLRYPNQILTTLNTGGNTQSTA